MNTADRRTEIINILIIRRRTTARELADEFGVTTRTIQKDIQALSPGYPIYTKEAAEKHTVFQVYFYNTQKIHQFRLFWWIFCDLDKISDYFKCYLCLFFVYQFNDPFEVYCKYSHRSLHLHVNEA